MAELGELRRPAAAPRRSAPSSAAASTNPSAVSARPASSTSSRTPPRGRPRRDRRTSARRCAVVLGVDRPAGEHDVARAGTGWRRSARRRAPRARPAPVAHARSRTRPGGSVARSTASSSQVRAAILRLVTAAPVATARSARRSATDGPITFAEYMELALYGPGGFYEQPPVGRRRRLRHEPARPPRVRRCSSARALRSSRTTLGDPDPLRVTEVGAGDGTLARQLLGALGDGPVATRRSSAARARATRSRRSTGSTVRRDPLRPAADLVLAHELLDNLPFRLVRAEARGGPRRPGRRPARRAPRAGRRRARRAPSATRHRRGDRVVPDGALAFVDDAGRRRSTRGYALLIDYGDVGSAPAGRTATAATAWSRICWTRPARPTSRPGVDFAWIAGHAEAAGPARPSRLGRRSATRCSRWASRTGSAPSSPASRTQLDARDGLGRRPHVVGRSRARRCSSIPARARPVRWLLLATQGSPPGVATPHGTERPIDPRSRRATVSRPAPRAVSGKESSMRAVVGPRRSRARPRAWCSSSVRRRSTSAVAGPASDPIGRADVRAPPSSEPGPRRAGGDAEAAGAGRETTEERLEALAEAQAARHARRASRRAGRRTGPRLGGRVRARPRTADDWEPAIAADPNAPFVYSSRPATAARSRAHGNCPHTVDGARRSRRTAARPGARRRRCAPARASRAVRPALSRSSPTTATSTPRS